MSVKVFVPTPLRAYTGNLESLECVGATIEQVLDSLGGQFPDLKKHLFNESGELRNFVNLYLNDEDIRYLKRLETPVKDGDTLSIVPSIAGGAASGTITVPDLSKEEIGRYSRHLIMPEVGLEGQKRLKAASVLCIGAGGLGSPMALYLAAAGVGRLGLVDSDVVDASNLQRQILHTTDDVGRPKLVSAREKLQAINPNVLVEPHEVWLSSENALELFEQYDIIADGTDNFPTRYLVNDACLLTGKPNVYASIFRFEGQASIFGTPDGPCYRCLYPEPPPPGLVPSCAEGGVLGILPGLMGVLQATEVVKLILGKGEPLVGRLLLFDALGMKFRELKLRRNPQCPPGQPCSCVQELIDYDGFCGIQPAGDSVPEVEEITVQELSAEQEAGNDLFVLDVRNPEEYEICKLEGSTLIPLPELLNRLGELDSAKEMVVHCKSGVRSAKAIEILKQHGFSRMRNLKGGILEWAKEIDPAMPSY